MEIARDEFDIPIVERSIDRSELYGADEIFFTGTAAGVLYVQSVDRRMVGDGKIGPITKRLGEYYERVVRGKERKYAGWLTRTYAGREVRA
jgi:branched-chain amino acid aminotransferase